ncbi:MAG: Polysaccharide biosynthesis protein [Parcubacteria group bacterium GW2011_GWB1_38_8]|uniref:Polysaccharide biosynthesis protein n=1 Tax=Candidatus Woesebacteria bacterium GW2011_GWA1_39_21b TaxID=1618551 RepID=A0A0G0N4Q5_9BACT|nr:MAG: Polysaccharide biosynthesis protein [Microgenomates group bacterium GW2011_GWC1_38_12]KKQ82712.1 MAG: Polysaccharide biosynthesis protein [Parcubacteria group bacterium GW2011_GWB1_38_8]KKR11164.1 MAG: Polysaccharide biosynthesis protein [Candidatus Woesebacteria bacterium GW2011_GWA1_39_21b]
MRNFLRNVAATSTFRESSITFIGTVINGALGALFYIITARFLGPVLFGVMSVSIATLTLVSDIGDLGTDTGLVNFVSRNIKKDIKRAKRFLKLSLEVKLIVSVFVFVLGYIFAPFIATEIFKKSEYIQSLRISFAGVGSILLFSYLTHSLQSLQSFWRWSGILVATNALRFALVIVVFYFGYLSIVTSLWIYIIAPLIGFFIGLKWLPRGFFNISNEGLVAKEFFRYNKWVAAFTLLAAVSSRIDTFITAGILTDFDVGIYQAATQMVKIVPQIVVAVGTVIAPKMATQGNTKEFIGYLKKSQLFVSGVCILGLTGIPVAIWFVPILFGTSYITVVPTFIVLFLAMLIFLFSSPIHTAVFYYFSHPKLFFWLALVNLVTVVTLGLILTSKYGAVGAAVTVLIGQLFNFIVPLVWVLRKIRK